MKPTKPTKRKRKPRSVPPSDIEKSPGIFGIVERVTTTRVRVKPDIALGFYSLCRLMALEHDRYSGELLSAMKPGTSSAIARFDFHRHAGAALRMVADRVLKTFSEAAIMANERLSRKQFAADVERLGKNHAAKPRSFDNPPIPETY